MARKTRNVLDFMRKGFGLFETLVVIGALSIMFISGLFLVRTAFELRKLENARESINILARSFSAYGTIPTTSVTFQNLLNLVLKTDLDPYGRPYVLVLANNIPGNAWDVCSMESTNLSVQLPGVGQINNVMAVILSAGEDGIHDALGQVYNSAQVVRLGGNLQLSRFDLYKVITLTEFKIKNCEARNQERRN